MINATSKIFKARGADMTERFERLRPNFFDTKLETYFGHGRFNICRVVKDSAEKKIRRK